MADRLRRATDADSDALAGLIARSARALQADDYPTDVLDIAIGTAFGLDRQLIDDGTYFLIERDDRPVACGGWSFRAKAYGGDGHGDTLHRAIAGRDAAKVRAFFVDPEFARQGLGSRILAACEAAAADAGFTHAEMVATPAGERLYSRRGWQAERRYAETLPGGLLLPVIRMTKRLQGPSGEI